VYLQNLDASGVQVFIFVWVGTAVVQEMAMAMAMVVMGALDHNGTIVSQVAGIGRSPAFDINNILGQDIVYWNAANTASVLFRLSHKARNTLVFVSDVSSCLVDCYVLNPRAIVGSKRFVVANDGEYERIG
jgi:hypothetical protein